MPGDAVFSAPIDRGAPLVATWARWAASAAALVAALVGAAQAYIVFTRSDRTLASFAWLLVGGGVLLALLVLSALRAEEARLARELRTARTGTAALRGIVLRRRAQLPGVMRLFATRLGEGAVLLADGDRDAAVDVLAGGSPLLRGGRLERLRALVEADVERASGTPEGFERCAEQLRAIEPVGNREAELYRTHVLVKSLLERGDGEGAMQALRAIESSADEEQLVYVAWLRVWFDLDAEAADYRTTWPALPEGLLRMAALLARAHGAEKLVEKLEARVSSIARPGREE